MCYNGSFSTLSKEVNSIFEKDVFCTIGKIIVEKRKNCDRRNWDSKLSSLFNSITPELVVFFKKNCGTGLFFC